MAVALRVVTGPVGEYHAEPPWDVFHPSAVAAELLGLPPGATTTLAASAEHQIGDGHIDYAAAVTTTLRDRVPLVLTTLQKRFSDGVPRIFTTVSRVRFTAGGEPARLDGRIVDVGDAFAYVPDPPGGCGIGVVECGETVVVVVTGAVDVGNRAEFTAAVRAALDVGDPDGDVYLDARHLQYCDTRTVAVLDETARRLGGRRRLVVLSPRPIVRRLLTLVPELDGRRPVLVLREIAGAEP